jgi:hypothetical protein
MIKTILTTAALVAFGLATFGVTIAHVAFVPLGLALFVATQLPAIASK